MRSKTLSMYKQLLLAATILLACQSAFAQSAPTIRTYKKAFPTYPFSDPDPVPKVGRIYPYFRYDGYAAKPVQKEWLVVELSNDYITALILPEIGGKVWAAIERKSGKSYVYYNHVVKFRDIAMRGPWTSGGIEPNYGIIGHTPNCATPVDYTTLTKADGSVSCVVGVLDLLTRTSWRLDINLPRDKAYITTSSFWHNSTPLEQPYYTWMNTGLPANGNLEFIYPGNRYIGHAGEFAAWPVNEANGKQINWYEQNDFGTYKSYHVFGKYTDFFGAYWHEDDFGMVRYGSYGDKPGKKIWIWGLSQQGMIWEKLLSDTDGQYVEVQSGRMFNQAAEQSTFTPFKHMAFAPSATDTWTEYWYPVVGTRGMVAASSYAALNLRSEGGWLKIDLSPVAPLEDTLRIYNGKERVYQQLVERLPLRSFKDSFPFSGNLQTITAVLGNNKLRYEAAPEATTLSRPVESPKEYDWNSVYGLYVQGKEAAHQRDYGQAMRYLEKALAKDAHFLPALTEQAKLLYRNRRYTEALAMARKAISIDAYDTEANYYYGLINQHLGNIADAKDGLEIAALHPSFRSAALLERARMALLEKDGAAAIALATKSLESNVHNMGSLHLLAIANRMQGNLRAAQQATDQMLNKDPLHHAARFEQYLLQPNSQNKHAFTSRITSELPQETYLELAITYHRAGLNGEATTLLQWAPQNAEVEYWQAWLQQRPLDTARLDPHLVFPFRTETAAVLEHLAQSTTHWLPQYHLALASWHLHDTLKARSLMAALGNTPAYAPFYAARAELNKNDPQLYEADLRHAAIMDPAQWRYGHSLAAFYLNQGDAAKAFAVSSRYYRRFPANYILGMQVVKALMHQDRYAEAASLLDKIEILPYEGATDGRQLYRETHLMLAADALTANNTRKALAHIGKSRQWPERLGAGKPYDADIDSRLEDWMAYTAYQAMGNRVAATRMLEAIAAHTHRSSQPTVANLLTAWALRQQGKPHDADAYLAAATKEDPAGEMAQWIQQMYRNTEQPMPLRRTDDNYRVLMRLLRVK